MPRPPVTAQQTEAALAAYHATRERAVRYVLGALDPSASQVPDLPYLDVLTRVQAQLEERWRAVSHRSRSGQQRHPTEAPATHEGQTDG